GVGLSIVKRIIEKLGGEVGVESRGIAGEGSIFSFTLPIVLTESPVVS
ncbi:MAG: PAS domain-containing sensor histidine kinase, partial [Phototrophicales bacterium]